MTEIIEPDLCIIGAGSAGLSAAAIAASLGASAVLIERGKMGGDCLNVGCVPSKALIGSANRMHAFREAAAFGIDAEAEPRVDFARVRHHIRGVIGAIAPNDSAERFSALGVRVIAGEARFTDERTVVVKDKTIRARRFVLATGSRPAIPPIPGLDRVPYLTNETVFDLYERPGHLVVIGGGPIGVEIAQAHRRLGARVTIVEAAPRLLAREDEELGAIIEASLREDGVAVRTGATVAGVERQESGISVVLADGQPALEGSHLLIAVGRKPVVEGLGLDKAGIAADGSGIVVDRSLKTGNSRVYAIGDCAGGAAAGARFTHVANHHAGLVVRNALFRLPIRVDAAPIPRVTYSDPELAAVGLSETEARSRGRGVRVMRWRVADNDRAQAERATNGIVKVVTTSRGTVLGCAIAAPHAGDLIVPWTLCIAKGLKAQDVAGLVFPYPTYSEVSKRAAVEFLRPAAKSPWLRRAMTLMRRLG